MTGQVFKSPRTMEAPSERSGTVDIRRFKVGKRLLEVPSNDTPISTIMSSTLDCVRPNMSIEGLTAFLLARNLNAVGVTNELGHLVGMVSRSDLLREAQDRGDGIEEAYLRISDADGIQDDLGIGFHELFLARSTVREIMTPFAFSLPVSASVGQAAALMAFEGINQLPILFDNGELAGVVTGRDIMQWLGGLDGYALPPIQLGGERHATAS